MHRLGDVGDEGPREEVLQEMLLQLRHRRFLVAAFMAADVLLQEALAIRRRAGHHAPTG